MGLDGTLLQVVVVTQILLGMEEMPEEPKLVDLKVATRTLEEEVERGAVRIGVTLARRWIEAIESLLIETSMAYRNSLNCRFTQIDRPD